MEAVGLAAGIVSLGLDLGTRLQTYVEGVKGAGDRLSALAADVSATASIVRQLADLLAEAETATERPLFAAQGIADIEAILRRCRRAYGVIVDLLLGAASGALTRTHAVLTAAGLSELTAARLARLSSRARWPRLEPRVRACQTELRAIKVDLLLSLNVAGLARHRKSGGDRTDEDENQKQDDEDEKKKLDEEEEEDEGAALLAVARKLMEQRAKHRKVSSSPPSPPPSSSSSSRASAASDPSSAGRSEGMRIASLKDAGTDLEAWLVHLDGYGPDEKITLTPVRGPSVESIFRAYERSAAGTEGDRPPIPPTLEQFTSLCGYLRRAVFDIMDRSQGPDAHVRTLVGALTHRMLPGLPVACEMVVFVAVGEEEEVVHLEDLDGRTWRVPFLSLRNSLRDAKGPEQLQSAVMRYCDGGSSSGGVGVGGHKFRLRKSDAQSPEGELISMFALQDYLRPGLRIRMDEDEGQRLRRQRQQQPPAGFPQTVPRYPQNAPGFPPPVYKLPPGTERYEMQKQRRAGAMPEIVDVDVKRQKETKGSDGSSSEWETTTESSSRRRSSRSSKTETDAGDAEYQELFGAEAEGQGAMEGLESVEDLLARWTGKEEAA